MPESEIDVLRGFGQEQRLIQDLRTQPADGKSVTRVEVRLDQRFGQLANQVQEG